MYSTCKATYRYLYMESVAVQYKVCSCCSGLLLIGEVLYERLLMLMANR